MAILKHATAARLHRTNIVSSHIACCGLWQVMEEVFAHCTSSALRSNFACVLHSSRIELSCRFSGASASVSELPPGFVFNFCSAVFVSFAVRCSESLPNIFVQG